MEKGLCWPVQSNETAVDDRTLFDDRLAMWILEDSCRCQKGRKGDVRSQCQRIMLNGALSKMGTLESSSGPSY